MSEAGLFLINAEVTISTAASSSRRIARLLKNGSTEIARTDNTHVTAWVGQVTTITSLIVGDTLEVQGWQGSGGNLAFGSSPGHNWRMLRLA
jgi:hypothetical protein